MFKQSSAKRIGVVAGLLGLALILFGSVWITVVFSHFEKIPSDWDQVDDLEGTFTDVDTAFLDRLQQNETVGQLLAAPEGQSLLNDPEVLAILGSPAVEQLASSPALVALASDPGILQRLASPSLLELLSNPDVLGLLQDPIFLAAIGDPAALQQLANHPVAGPLLGDPAVLTLLQDPAFQQLLQSGVLATLGTQPQMLELIMDPTLGAMLANPAVQALLADPDALSLVFDPRTQKVLANPADLPTVTGQVVIHRERRVTGTDGNRLFINEQKTYLDPTTGQEWLAFPKENHDLIIDRKSKEYLPGTAEGRTGFWGLPFHVDRDRSYASWVTAARRPLDAVYTGTEEIQGLETYRYVVDVTDLDMGIEETLGLPLVVDALITVWVEPKTGSIVRIEDRDAVSVMDPSGNKFELVVFDVSHNEETVSQLVGEAKDNRNKIVWFGSVMPWMSMVLGIFLIAVAVTLIGLGTLRKRPGGASS